MTIFEYQARKVQLQNERDKALDRAQDRAERNSVTVLFRRNNEALDRVFEAAHGQA